MRIRIVLPVLAAMSAAALTAKVEAASTQASPSSEAAESVTVTATPLPKRDAVDEFIYSYPTQVRTTEKIARWRKGICPAVYGLPQHFASFITTRLTAIARNVGAPVDSDPKCRQNVEIVFTDKPQALGDDLRKYRWAYLGYFDNFRQADRLAKVSHDIQAWYLTATVSYSGYVHVDNPRQDFLTGTDYLPDGKVFYATGTGRFNSGPGSTLYNVVIVADPSKLKEYSMGSLADYIAMLALSQAKDFDACWEVPSIANLLSKDCATERKTATISDNDTRFLYGLYRMDPIFSVFQQRAQIRYFTEHRDAAGRGAKD